MNVQSSTHAVGANAGGGNTFNVTPVSGYKAIGVVGFQNNRGNATAITACLVDVGNQTVYTYTRNLTSTAYNDIFEVVRVLYVRTGMVG